MLRKRHFTITAITLLAIAGLLRSQQINPSELRRQADKKFSDGNYKEALTDYRTICLHKDDLGQNAQHIVSRSVQSLQNLGKLEQIDELLESTVKAHPEHWQVLQAVATSYRSIPHQGQLVAGEFQRGYGRRRQGVPVETIDRDRVRALQLLMTAEKLVLKTENADQISGFYLQLARSFRDFYGSRESWRLQLLTDLEQLPDPVKGYPRFRADSHAPVDEEGQPVFFEIPDDWAAAKTDGERWRWALAQAVEHKPSAADQAEWLRADFLYNQFGVHSMQRFFQPWMLEPDGEDERDRRSNIYQLHTLTDDETICRLATGIQRLELPEEHNHVAILKKLAGGKGFAETAVNRLAEVYTNRRQFDRAADQWRASIKKFGNSNWKKQRLDQIVKPWGQLEPVLGQPAGKGATIEYRFRNGNRVDFEAQRIDIAQLLADIKTYLKSSPQRFDWSKVQLQNIGWQLINGNQAKYVKERTAQWRVKLDPADVHWDRRRTVTTPLEDSGAYLVTAKMRDGNTSRAVLWLNDTAIVRKPLHKKNLYFVADASNGKPIADANMEFFGYRVRRVGNAKQQVDSTNFARKTDHLGRVMLESDKERTAYQWMVVARTKQGRFAYLGFHGVWVQNYYDQEYNQAKGFIITDRPVYRPEQKVKFKGWLRHAKYDQEGSSFANQNQQIEILDPKGKSVYKKTLKTDAYGGVDGEFDVPGDATLGVYSVRLVAVGMTTTFRIEEYKKPEFEVTIESPEKPVMLGEKIEARVNARYYFGAPVTNATAKIKVMRHEHTAQWYPYGPWDWCFGPGYWWYAYDYPWYPGWEKWVGCRRPFPFWWGQWPQNPPEVVLEIERPIGPEGEIEFVIDTSVAQALHGDKDHRYTVTAEVRDASRRTIVGSGEVLAARKPFRIYSWVHRGYYRQGETVRANFQAFTLDKKPVKGQGVVRLLSIEYDDERQPKETEVGKWDIASNEEGVAELQIKATRAGQFRLSCELTDDAGHTVEGGYIFQVVGEGDDGKEFRFQDIELIPEKQEYAPGEVVRLQVNTDRANSTVMLFVRPANGVYLPPQIVQVKGQSSIVEVAVVKRDMPNFFVEAVTVSGGKVHTDVKEIVVPPESRVLNVEVLPDAQEYRPGAPAKVKLHLTDHTGENFVGSTVVTVYDKAVEYISGGTNISDIKEFFWKWRRRHHPNAMHNLSQRGSHIQKSNEPQMQTLGAFGHLLVEQEGRAELQRGAGRGRANKMMAAKSAPGGAVAETASLAIADEAVGGGFAADASDKDSGQAAAGGGFVEPTVRKNFADTALWTAALTTNDQGIAEVSLEMPESLTTWKVKVWGMGHGTRVGAGEAEVITRKNFLLRLQAPRFFVEKDEVVLSAVVHNYLPKEKIAEVALQVDQSPLTIVGDAIQTVSIPADGETRVNWRVRVTGEGEAVVRMLAKTDEESDAMEMKFPSYVHGMLKMEAWAGTVRPDDDSAKVTVEVPAQRRVEESLLEVRYSPTLAGAMVDALPYLIEYPYGCTEQTLNRFLPAVITQKMLLEMNLDLAEIREKRSNLNAQEIGDDVKRAAQWKRRSDHNPVFDREELERVVANGVERLTNMQNADGGWGWFSGFRERSYPHTTAVVVRGLLIAQQNDVPLVPGVLERGVKWLEKYQAEQVRKLKNADGKVKPWKHHADNLDAYAFGVLTDAKRNNRDMLNFLYRDRNHISVFAKAIFAQALYQLEDEQKLAMLLRNLKQYLEIDEENHTAYLDMDGAPYWYWYGSDIEANAYYLKLLSRTDPEGDVPPMLVKYLLNNRKHATYWKSTRDTSLCVEAFADYLRATKELDPEMVVEIWLDGEKQKEVAIDRENLFSFDNRFVLAGKDVADGSHQVEIRRRGRGPVYFNAYLTNFTLEDHIEKTGLEVKVERFYYRLIPEKATAAVVGSRGQARQQAVEKYRRERIANLGKLKSGDLVEIDLKITSKNDYEYLLFEDMKAAGFEPVEVRSGYSENPLGAYMELRDNRVSFFVRQMPRGEYSLSYRMRAETPGRFSALPTRASAMYAPELKGNSDEIKVIIED